MIGRVHGRRWFERFRTEGRRVHAGDLWCVRVVDTDAECAHVAYAIGKPVGPAVVRNRVRRRLRAAVNAQAEGFPPGHYLIGVRPAAAERSFEELSVMLQHIVQRLERMS